MFLRYLRHESIMFRILYDRFKPQNTVESHILGELADFQYKLVKKVIFCLKMTPKHM